MAAKNLVQMQTIVMDAMGKSANATAISGALLSARCTDFINWGQQRIARAYHFDELDVLQDSITSTVPGVKTYPLITGTNNLGLIRPKDLESVMLMDLENSRKLTRWPMRKFDNYYPRPENYSNGKPTLYIRFGYNIDIFRIPDLAYAFKIRYPQWPIDLVNQSDVTQFIQKDQLVITAAILEGYLHFEEYNDVKIWAELFVGRLHEAIMAEGDMDWEPKADPFKASRGGYESGEPWIDPYGSPMDPLYGYAG